MTIAEVATMSDWAAIALQVATELLGEPTCPHRTNCVGAPADHSH